MENKKKEEKFETQYCGLSPEAVDFIMAWITMTEEELLSLLPIVGKTADNR